MHAALTVPERVLATRRWSPWVGRVLGVVVLAWWVLSYGWLPDEGASAAAYVPFAAHHAIGVVIIYVAVVGAINTTRIVLAGGALRVTRGPLPWPDGNEYEADAIRRVTVEERRTHSILPDGTRGDDHSSRWAVMVETDVLGPTPLVGRLSHRGQADAIRDAVAEGLPSATDPST